MSCPRIPITCTGAVPHLHRSRVRPGVDLRVCRSSGCYHVALVDETPTSDFQLLSAWRDGDSEAGGALMRRHFSAVYRFFASKVDDAVEDLTQRTFLACVESRDRFDEGRNTTFRAYLFGIARKQLLRYFEEVRRLGHRTELGEVSIASLLGSPSRRLYDREEQQLLLLAVRTIPLDYQITLELHYWEDMSVAEVASVLEVPSGTIKSRLHRAKNMLRDAIMDLRATPELRESTLTNLEGWARSMRTHRGDSGSGDG